MTNNKLERIKKRLSEDSEARKDASFISRELLQLVQYAVNSETNPKLAKAMSIGTAAIAVGAIAKDVWTFYKKNTADNTFTIKITEDDAIFEVVEDWLMEALPEDAQRSIYAQSSIVRTDSRSRMERVRNRFSNSETVPRPSWEREPTSSDDAEDKDRVIIDYTFDGTIVQSLNINGHAVEIYTQVPENNTKVEGKLTKLTARSINIVCKTVEARKAVLEEIESQSQYLVKTQPRMFISGKWGDFRKKSYIQPRSRDSVVLKEGQMDRILEHVARFLDNKKAYDKADLPFRTGILLYGEPGSGKSSTALAIANELAMDVYIIALSALESDDALNECFGSIPKNSIIILEDIDIAHAVKDRDKDENGVTMSGMLNVLDGFQSPPGVITIMTTNRLDVLDEAIKRPGRVDLLENLDCLDDYQVRGICNYFMGQVPENLPHITPEDGITSAEMMGVIRKHLPDFENAAADLVEFLNERKLLTAALS